MIINQKSVGAEEKIKQLVESEEAKRKELEEKKKELEDKKKELAQLEHKRKKEIEETRKSIEEQIEELATEEKIRFEELEELSKRRREEQAVSLEQSIEEEEKKGRARAIPQQKGYGAAVEEILRGNPTVYDITNYNVMNQLERIARDARERPLSATERNFVDLLEQHAERMKENDFYRDKDPNNYMSRELDKIDQINRMVREKEKPGDYRT